ncbi:MAG: ComF family protein [Elusimicrobiaceae bacterium]|nr:ComF family protein [Elusimicrobiaceae bacterium]
MKTKKSFIRTVFSYFLHFLFPKTCLACGCDLDAQTQHSLCSCCLAALRTLGPLICRRCGAVLKSGGAHCYACRGTKAKKYKCSVIRSAFVFNDSSRAWIHALKYGGADYLGKEMGKEMSLRFCRYPELSEAELIIPVPLFSKKYRQRGYNQSELLARSFSAELSLPLDKNSLKRIRHTVSQTTLGRKERLENMAGAFVCINPKAVYRKTILLIDDVATTGATLEGCAQALKQAGAKKVLAYTFARE